MEVIILAGGLGTRLRSEVKDVPKCMAPVAGKRFLWYILQYLTRYRVNRVILSVGYLREVIFEWIDEHKDEFPFEFDYAVEEEPLGTGGGIRLALSKAKTQHVVVLNGDTFFDVNLNEFHEEARGCGEPIALALKPMTDFDRYGTVELNECQVITRFNEKQHCDAGLINGGVYVINRISSIFDNLPEKFSFEKEILEPQCRKRNLYGIRFDGYFIDIGIPEDYHKAGEDFMSLFNV